MLSVKQTDVWGCSGLGQRIRRRRQRTFFLKMRQDFVDYWLILDTGEGLPRERSECIGHNLNVTATIFTALDIDVA